MAFDLKLFNEWTDRKNEGSPFYIPSSTQANEDQFLKAFRDKAKTLPIEEAEPEETETFSNEEAYQESFEDLNKERTSSVTSKTKYDLDELAADEEFQIVATRFLESVDEDEDIFEYLRDSDYRVSSALYRGYKSGKWSDQQKSDYAYLRQAFDNADVGSVSNMVKATADGVVDFITDPIHLLTLMLTPFTGGASAFVGLGVAKLASTKLATNIAQAKLLKTGLKKLRKLDSPRGTNFAITEGIVQGTGSSIGNQNIEINSNIRDSFSSGEVGLLGLIGGTAGGVLALGGSAAISGFKNSKTMKRIFERQKNKEEPIDVNPKDRSKAKQEWDRLSIALKNIPLVTKTDDLFGPLKKGLFKITGKATSPLLKYTKDSEVLEKFLKAIRYDALKGFAGETYERVVKSVGLATGERTSRYRQKLHQIFAETKLERTGWTNHLTAVQNEQLSFILNRPALLKRIGIKKIIDKETGEVSYVFKGAIDSVVKKLDDAWKSSESPTIIKEDQIKIIQKLEKIFGEKNVNRKTTNINKKTVMAALRLRQLADDVYEDAQNISPLEGAEILKLFEDQQKITGYYFPRFWRLQAIKENRDVLEELLFRSDHSKLNDNFITVRVRDPKDPEIIETKLDFRKIKSDEAHFTTFFKKYDSSVTTFKEAIIFKAKKTGKKLTEREIAEQARALKAKALVQNMLDKEFPTLQFMDEVTKKPLKHQRSRVFHNLSDQDLINGGFLENNIEQVYINYFDNMASAIERKRYLGVTLSEFNERYAQRVRADLINKGYEGEEADKVIGQMRDIYEVTTGTKQRQQGWLDTNLTKTQNFLKVSQQLAHLPLATVSSLTEPLIILTKIGVADTPEAAVAFATAAGKQMKKSFSRFFTRFEGALHKQGFTKRSVKSFKDLTDPEWAEAYTFSIATEYSAQQRLTAMYAGSTSGKWSKGISEKFFSVSLLSAWTQAVQFGAFKTSKSVIKRLTKELSSGKLTTKQKAYNISKLREIGIDPKKAVRNYKQLSKDGVLNEEDWMNSAFYQNDVLSSSNLFAREIILNPAASEANKPLWFNSALGQLVMQFASYPTVFNNTVLRNMVRDTVQNPAINGAKVIGATALMTGGAILTNAMRSEGRSLEESDARITADAISRWGGFGPLDYIFRYAKGLEYGGMTAGSTIKAPFGPLVADVIDSVQFRHSPLQIAAQNIPFYSALPKEQRDALKAWARGTKKSDEKPYSYIVANRPFAKGGRVNVPNAVAEPEERKMRGMPLTYAEMAGPFVQDKEDRLGFAEGGRGIEDVPENTNYAYSVLTKNDDYGYFLEDKDPIEIYEADEISADTPKESYFVTLESPNYHALNKKVEESTNVGMHVSKVSVNLKGRYKVESKVKVDNTLDINKPEVSSEIIYQELKERMTMPKDIEILKDIEFELDARDDALENDEDKNDKASALMEKSKSIVIKDGLLNLGFDSVSYNNKKNIVLLKASQLIPVEIKENIIRKKVYAGGLMRTLNRKSFQRGGLSDVVNKLFRIIPLTKRFLESQYNRMSKNKSFKNDNLSFIKNQINFSEDIAIVESNNNRKKMSDTGARGTHQFTQDTIDTTLRRFLKQIKDEDILKAVKVAAKKDPREWNKDEENLMFFGNLFLRGDEREHLGVSSKTDSLFRSIGEGTLNEAGKTINNSEVLRAKEHMYIGHHWSKSKQDKDYRIQYEKTLKRFRGFYDENKNILEKITGIYFYNDEGTPILGDADYNWKARVAGVAPPEETPSRGITRDDIVETLGKIQSKVWSGFYHTVKKIFEGNQDPIVKETIAEEAVAEDRELKPSILPSPTIPAPNLDEQIKKQTELLNNTWMPLEDGSPTTMLGLQGKRIPQEVIDAREKEKTFTTLEEMLGKQGKLIPTTEPAQKGFGSVEESHQAYIDEVLSNTPYLDDEGKLSPEWKNWYDIRGPEYAEEPVADDSRENFVIGGVATALGKTVSKAASRKGTKLRKDYLNKEYLKSLKPTKKAAKNSEFNLSAEEVFTLLEDGRINTKEAQLLLKDSGFKKQTIKKILRPFKEIELQLGDDFVTYREPYIIGGLVSRAANKMSKSVLRFSKQKPKKQSIKEQAKILEDYIGEDFSFTRKELNYQSAADKKFFDTKPKGLKPPKKASKASLLFKDKYEKRKIERQYRRDLEKYERQERGGFFPVLRKQIEDIKEEKNKYRYLTGIVTVEPNKLKKMKVDYKLDDIEYIEALKSLALIKNEQVTRSLSLMSPYIPKKIRNQLYLRDVDDVFSPEQKDFEGFTDLLEDWSIGSDIDIGKDKAKADFIKSISDEYSAINKPQMDTIKKIHKKGIANLSDIDEKSEMQLLDIIDSYLHNTYSQGQYGFYPQVDYVTDIFEDVQEWSLLSKTVPKRPLDPNVPKNVTPLGPNLIFNKETGKFETVLSNDGYIFDKPTLE